MSETNRHYWQCYLHEMSEFKNTHGCFSSFDAFRKIGKEVDNKCKTYDEIRAKAILLDMSVDDLICITSGLTVPYNVMLVRLAVKLEIKSCYFFYPIVFMLNTETI